MAPVEHSFSHWSTLLCILFHVLSAVKCQNDVKKQSINTRVSVALSV